MMPKRGQQEINKKTERMPTDKQKGYKRRPNRRQAGGQRDATHVLQDDKRMQNDSGKGVNREITFRQPKVKQDTKTYKHEAKRKAT